MEVSGCRELLKTVPAFTNCMSLTVCPSFPVFVDKEGPEGNEKWKKAVLGTRVKNQPDITHPL
jgi:hypothetical protein